MRIGEFDVMVASYVDSDKLVAEIQKGSFELGAVFVRDGKPMIELGPNRENEFGVWTIDYHIWKQIMKTLDDFLASIGHPQSDLNSEGSTQEM